MKIYTGRGDDGNTNIIGGRTVKKTDPRVKAYGSVDELNSLIGVLWAQIEAVYEGSPENKKKLTLFRKELKLIQDSLFDIGTDLANRDGKPMPKISKRRIETLESSIDFYQTMLPEIEYFVLPGGGSLGATAHYVRTVTRRVEITVLEVAEVEEVDRNSLVYLNRLSDYFFSLARYLNKGDKKEEVFYKGTGKVFH